MKYKVIHAFCDLQDKTKEFPNGRVYAVGDTFPKGKRYVTLDRIDKLATTMNSLGIQFIEKVGE